MAKPNGFTLIELMIVVAIIGILSAIALPKFADLIRKSNEGSTKGSLSAIKSALSIYYAELEGWYPTDTVPGNASVDGSLGSILTMQNGKYLKEMPPCYTPPYHQKTSDVDDRPDIAEGGMPGVWGYQGDRNPGPMDQLWGDFWVNCTHTDSKSTDWGTY